MVVMPNDARHLFSMESGAVNRTHTHTHIYIYIYVYIYIYIHNVGLTLNLGHPSPLTIEGPEKWKSDVLNNAPTVLRAPAASGITSKGMVWIRSRIFRAAIRKHIKQGLPNKGQILNKRRRKHIKEGLYTKVTAILYTHVKINIYIYMYKYIYTYTYHKSTKQAID